MLIDFNNGMKYTDKPCYVVGATNDLSDTTSETDFTYASIMLKSDYSLEQAEGDFEDTLVRLKRAEGIEGESNDE